MEIQTARWIARNTGLVWPTVLVAKDANNKAALGAALGLDVFVDDRLKNCLEMEIEVPKCRIFLHTASHNVNEPITCLPRVGSLAEMWRILDERKEV